MTVLLLLVSLKAHAQWQTTHWLHLDGAYAQRQTKQTEQLDMNARRAFARGELGLNLLPHLSVSGGANYQDGVAALTGRTATGGAAPAYAGGRVFETRALAHLLYRPIVISGGLAQLEEASDLSGSYRVRTKFEFNPVMVTLNLRMAYVQIEHDIWTKGSVDVRLSDLGGGRADLSYKLTKATGQGAEVGLIWPNRIVSTKVFVGYHRWITDAAPAKSDGVESVPLARAVVTELRAGVGLAF